MAHQANGRNYQFYGVNKKKSRRRSNGGRPRKMYPYASKEQIGTPMEKLILNNYDTLQDQYNVLNRGPGEFFHTEATGRLGTHWGNVRRRMTSGSAVARHIAKNGGSIGQARSGLLGVSGAVKFGADPKSK